MGRELTDVVSLLLLPPASALLILAAGALLVSRRRRIGFALAATGFVALWISSLPAVGDALLQALEPPPASRQSLAGAQAIVVLGATRAQNAPEYGEDTVSGATLVRLRYGARLARETGLPLLVAGGKPYGGQLSEGETMARALEQDFGLRATWIETRSTTTAENASGAAAILRPVGRSRIVLVTSAWHMPRAVRAFERAGFQVVAAPTGYVSRERSTLLDWLPSGRGLAATQAALHELLGLAWYRLRGLG